MSYFTKDFIAFFKELEKNNSKEWFDENRKRYEKSVKKPFYSFVDEMIGKINAVEPSITLQAKDAVTRINRDIRFSPDKTPYNTHLGAVISEGGRKDKSVPGLFIRLSADSIAIFGGAYGIDKNQIENIRQAIAYNPDAFTQLISENDFVAKFGEIKGERYKRIPKEYQSLEEELPMIANKNFYYVAELPSKHLLDDKLPERIMDYWHTAKPVKDFLAQAIFYEA